MASELQLTPLEAWQHLHRLVENINALTATLVRIIYSTTALVDVVLFPFFQFYWGQVNGGQRQLTAYSSRFIQRVSFVSIKNG